MQVRWDERSLEKLDHLADQFCDQLLGLLAEGLVDVAESYVVPRAKHDAPFFEGTLARDVGVWESPHIRGDWATLLIGESGRLFTYTEGDPSPDGPDPFSYPLAKHDGARAHRVWIYAPDGGAGSLARAKLRRYYSQIAGDVPETRDELREQNRQAAPQDRIRPFLDVDPALTARPFLAETITGAGAAITTDLLSTYLRKHLQRIWR